MKIAFMGTQGTGKTTLLELFLKDHSEYQRSVNIQRILNQTYGLGINGGADYQTQYAITAHYASEVVAYENYIADRSVLDTFVYARTCNKISEENLQTIENTFSKAVEEYDVIFYLPIEFEAPEDGIRNLTKEFLTHVDGLMKEYKDKYPNKIKMLSGGIKERYIDMLQYLWEIREK